MKILLSPAASKAELIGLAAWLGVLFVTPALAWGTPVIMITVLLGFISWLHLSTSNYLVWRGLGVAYVFILAVGFSYVINTDVELKVFALPLVVLIVISSSILFVSVMDFFICSTLTWLAMWPNMQVGSYDDLKVYVLIFFLASLAIGVVVNSSYLGSLRNLLMAESKFRILAETDFLTSILNRRAFIGRFEELLSNGSSGYMMMLDIDGFKLKNDQFGHDLGDKILCTMAACLKSTVGSDSYGRIGGEEFGVIILTDDSSVACDYALRLLDSIRYSLAPPYNYTCSAGLAFFSSGSEMSHVLKCADRSLYQAKNNGKNCAYLDGGQIGLKNKILEIS
ncbi:GGDEF domain-containing protein [Pseudomonas sivasensis]|uniref:GGDEF domain-containing protein n=1 Tax=Pseudomonas sivasensis TaxID=1880678 RepID=UPI003CFF1353